MVQTRIQKLISQWGIASRRQAESMILAGRVSLNGKPVKLGQTADPDQDQLAVDNQIISSQYRPKLDYLLINKPLGCISTCYDPQGRTTVMDLLPPNLKSGQGLHPVGRLDANSTGALILTNDGNLTLKLTHPRYHQPKTYQVWVKGHPSTAAITQWQRGVWLEGEGQYTLPAHVEVLKHNNSSTLLKVILREGKNRQIRKVASQLGIPVLKLHRIAIGKLTVQDLKPGAYRRLHHKEVITLSSSVPTA